MKKYALLLPLLASGCGRELPTTYSFDGVRVEVIGEAWTPSGDALLVRPMQCPWTPGGLPTLPSLATIRVHGQSRENICLIFTKEEVREAYQAFGSLPIEHEEFKWAKGWPGNWMLESFDAAVKDARAAESIIIAKTSPASGEVTDAASEAVHAAQAAANTIGAESKTNTDSTNTR